jgi:hypothetical protein
VLLALEEEGEAQPLLAPLKHVSSRAQLEAARDCYIVTLLHLRSL